MFTEISTDLHPFKLVLDLLVMEMGFHVSLLK